MQQERFELKTAWRCWQAQSKGLSYLRVSAEKELEAYHKGHDVHCQQGSHFLTSNCIPYQKWFQQDTCVAAGNGKCREEVCLGGIAIVSSD